MKTYEIVIGFGGAKYDNFVVLGEEFSEALDNAVSYIEVEQRKKMNKNINLYILSISERDNIKEIKRISGEYVYPSFKK